MVGEGLSVPLLKPLDASDLVLLEMKKGVLLDAGNILNQFSNLDRNIRDFCDACAVEIAEPKRLPRLGPHNPPASLDSLVGKAAPEFASAEDYVFFVLLSTINNRIYMDIFRPFHPAAPEEDNEKYEEEYMRKIDTCMSVVPFSACILMVDCHTISLPVLRSFLEISDFQIRRRHDWCYP